MTPDDLGYEDGEVIMIVEDPLRHVVGGPNASLWTRCSRFIMSSGKRAEGPPTCLWCVARVRR